MWPTVILSLLGGLVSLAIAALWSSNVKGKKFAILGARYTGKTTLIEFLFYGEIREEYLGTAKPKKFSGKTIKLQDIQLHVIEVIDVPGDTSAYDKWAAEYKEAEIVCYLIDGSKIYKQDPTYVERVFRDMQSIAKWFDARKNSGQSPPKFFLVATHCDLIIEYENLPSDGKLAFTDEFWSMDVTQKIIAYGKGRKHVNLVAGSLCNKQDCERLASDILREIA